MECGERSVEIEVRRQNKRRGIGKRNGRGTEEERKRNGKGTEKERKRNEQSVKRKRR
ncbi:MAG: hypothetical protein IJE21_04760 [Alistipes sp.]|nr:hypothetical protein [Alistipes sp.]